MGEGGGARNPFGEAFAKAGYEWTAELCTEDSDGDGQSNGLELGDPHCQWLEGSVPARIVDISHPGSSDSKTSATSIAENATSSETVPGTNQSSPPLGSLRGNHIAISTAMSTSTTTGMSATTGTVTTTTSTVTTTTSAAALAARAVDFQSGAQCGKRLFMALVALAVQITLAP